ncbi:putative DNA modification/repair radical SAM protein [Thermoanaerobacterium thermosaccharolyticum]|uniref:putative DNA modification/repair radical SAM protein n=1 Tax=Thermoanaerobacterium thermosaccharolyticum TaxID=1517 RepID=UPI000C07E90F|nr:putative DNA modification/repair radical SAM protein [Thermoanaerobacterium thermosaccharolyticum]PHO06813.1 putative DNA modification/repair radical SAM protein [Thermoanaerobacterium thermosaccharolyticum]
MELHDKIRILADAAKYDVSCSSSGSNRENKNGGIGNASFYGICHSWSDDGRCISLLKILFTNICIYNCSYCVNRCSNDIERALFTPDELADLTINFYRRNYIEGLFLSSAVYKSPDYTMELLIKTVKKLREDYNFNGYIHLKAIPGADINLIRLAGLYADRMSVNIELPSKKSLKLLAPQKSKESIIKPMSFIHNQLLESNESKKLMRYSDKFVPAGQTTQLIIGATPESDRTILKLSENLYKLYNLKRVYYSAYIPVSNGNNISGVTSPPLLREHRLYQADWLLRYYNFSADELLNDENPNFNISLDPKSDWALKNLSLFPVEVNTADYNMLLRVPGIGVRTAKRIISARKASSLSYDSLKKLGVVLKRAKYFITCNGKYYGGCEIEASKIKNRLLPKSNVLEGQLSMFDSFYKTESNLPILV